MGVPNVVAFIFGYSVLCQYVILYCTMHRIVHPQEDDRMTETSQGIAIF